jgi:hypothetical protein
MYLLRWKGRSLELFWNFDIWSYSSDQDSINCKAFVNMEMNFPVLHNAGHLLANCVGSCVLTPVVMYNHIFWDTEPRSPLKFNQLFEGLCLLPPFTLVPCLPGISGLKTKAKCCFETRINFQRTTRCYIPGNRNLKQMMGYWGLEQEWVSRSLWIWELDREQ